VISGEINLTNLLLQTTLGLIQQDLKTLLKRDHNLRENVTSMRELLDFQMGYDQKDRFQAVISELRNWGRNKTQQNYKLRFEDTPLKAKPFLKHIVAKYGRYKFLLFISHIFISSPGRRP